MQIRSTYVDSSCNRDISKIYWSCTLNITKHRTPILFSALLLVIATNGEKKWPCMNLEFFSPGLIIIKNWINPTQTTNTSRNQPSISGYSALNTKKKKNFFSHLITSFHLAPLVPVYFHARHPFVGCIQKYTKTEYDLWRWGLNNVTFAPTSNSRDKKYGKLYAQNTVQPLAEGFILFILGTLFTCISGISFHIILKSASQKKKLTVMAPKIWAFVPFEAISLVNLTTFANPTSPTNVSHGPRKIQI